MGDIMRKLLLAATAALAMAAPAAAVTTYNFSLTGAFTATWSMPASPTPDTPGDALSDFSGITFTLPDTSTLVSDFSIYSNSVSGGIYIYDQNSDDPVKYRGLGDEIYTGTPAAPTFKLGTFTLYNISNIQNGTLTISGPSVGGVPEPASWAMLIAGFGLTGAAMRRRRVGATTA